MKEFIKLSKYAGMREDIVQAGGGNSSCKISSNQMLIKASGYTLSEVSDSVGVSLVNHQMIRNFFKKHTDLQTITHQDSEELLKRVLIEGNKPSIESFLHAVSKKYTLHTHPVVVNALLCRKNGEDRIKELFPKSLFVPYATPGVELAKRYFEVYSASKREEMDSVEVVFLQNHGLVVSAETEEIVIQKHEEILMKIADVLGMDHSKYHNATFLWKNFPDKIVWTVNDANVISSYSKVKDRCNHALCPDCTVYLGKKILVLETDDVEKELSAFIDRYGYPAVIEYQHRLYILADNVKKALEIQSVLSFSVQVICFNRETEGLFLSEEEQDFLVNWEAEKYRKNLKD